MAAEVGQSRYIHGTEPDEQARLARLNRLTNEAFVRFLRVPSGARVLEVGSGLGLLAAEVAAAAAGVRVVGVEISPDQIAAAIKGDALEYRHGDAHHLQFEDGSFDLVYARYLLEHVGDPVRVLREMRRVARPGARVAVMENDISLVRFDPPCPSFDRVWTIFGELQRELGGDALIGRRLYRLFRSAGFAEIELSVQPEAHWQGSPGFASWVENVIGNLAGARAALLAGSRCTTAELEVAIAEISALIDDPVASAGFIWNRAMAVR